MVVGVAFNNVAAGEASLDLVLGERVERPDALCSIASRASFTSPQYWLGFMSIGLRTAPPHSTGSASHSSAPTGSHRARERFGSFRERHERDEVAGFAAVDVPVGVGALPHAEVEGQQVRFAGAEHDPHVLRNARSPRSNSLSSSPAAVRGLDHRPFADRHDLARAARRGTAGGCTGGSGAPRIRFHPR